ncbi:hypothetical protein QYF61_006368 [Mycteria americana]|uniref:Uncharacterized protein n=1 Tax=Mycteria americana TaxID=33587 RepID=A0AAN7N1J1_MYCAM|nr:hypothetical protein QYF61_006368 [Mycteria americana]
MRGSPAAVPTFGRRAGPKLELQVGTEFVCTHERFCNPGEKSLHLALLSRTVISKEKRPERTPACTDLLTGDSFSSSPAVGRNTGFFDTNMGAAASQEAPLCSPLECILKHCNTFGGDPMTKNQLK